MNPLLLLLGQGLGLDWQWLLGQAEDVAGEAVKGAFRTRLAKKRVKIAADLTAQGWSYDSVTEERPDAPAAFVADIQYRCWRAVFRRVGLLIDGFRDAHHAKVLEAVQDQITPETPAEEVVKLVIKAEERLTF